MKITQESSMYRLHGFFTQNSMKPIYVLEELGVDYTFCFVDLVQGANRSEEFQQMTPVGKVPVLEHGGKFLFESGAICRYVASEEKSPLFPADKFERAQVDQWMTYFTCHPGRWLTTLFFEKLIKPKAGFGETNQEVCEEAEKFARQQLKIVDNWLETREWLANGALSIAEPFALAYLEQVNYIDFPLDDYPSLEAWFNRLQARESTARARAQVEPYAQAIMS
jgi:glutathione S-transferase